MTKVSASSSQESPGTLPQARLIRTTHADDGTSIFASDSPMPQFFPFGPQNTAFTVLDTRATLPANNMDPTIEQPDALPRCSPQGALFCITDIQPGGAAPIHRTQSLDYCAILAGEIVIGLDGGEEKTAKAGDFIVQQGVNHAWVNRSSATCRILFVMLGSNKVQLNDGTILEETVF